MSSDADLSAYGIISTGRMRRSSNRLLPVKSAAGRRMMPDASLWRTLPCNASLAPPAAVLHADLVPCRAFDVRAVDLGQLFLEYSPISAALAIISSRSRAAHRHLADSPNVLPCLVKRRTAGQHRRNRIKPPDSAADGDTSGARPRDRTRTACRCAPGGLNLVRDEQDVVLRADPRTRCSSHPEQLRRPHLIKPRWCDGVGRWRLRARPRRHRITLNPGVRAEPLAVLRLGAER